MVVSPTPHHRERKGGDKESSIAMREIRIEASPSLKKEGCNIARNKVQKFLSGELSDFHDCAREIKKALEVSFPGTWHVVVGKVTCARTQQKPPIFPANIVCITKCCRVNVYMKRSSHNSNSTKKIFLWPYIHTYI